MKALIPQGLIGRPNYFGLLNNSLTLIICESLRQIGEMACVTSAWSSRGQTLKADITFIYTALAYSLPISTNLNFDFDFCNAIFHFFMRGLSDARFDWLVEKMIV